MKNQVFFAVLAVLAVFASGAVLDPKPVEPVTVVDAVEVTELSEGVEPTAAANRNLNIGWINTGDRLLHRNYYYKAPMANAIQSQDITYRGNSSTRITAVRATEVGYTQFATARVIAGGINSNTVTIRLSTARSYGYYFAVEIWGR